MGAQAVLLKRARVVAVAMAATMLGAVGYAYAAPGIAVCALADAVPMSRVSPGVYSAGLEIPVFEVELLASARDRIAETFGAAQARPIVVFWGQQSWLARFNLNVTAGAHFLGFRSCVLIGPNGRSTDVVAHELMHAEIFERIGPWARLTRLPVWFDEGLAMQVDRRARFDLPATSLSGFVRQYSGSAFFASDAVELTRNYAAAKAEVAKWVRKIGQRQLYPVLERIRAGADVAALFDGQGT